MRLLITIAKSNRDLLFKQTIKTLIDTINLPDIDIQMVCKNGMKDGEIKTVNSMMEMSKDWDYWLRSDDDMFYSSGWLSAMLAVLQNKEVKLVGGSLYPTAKLDSNSPHKVLTDKVFYNEVTIAAGNCWMMTKETWELFKPLQVEKKKEQEDVNFCRRIREKGYKVATLKNEKLCVHCGIINSKGRGRGKLVEDYMLNLIKSVNAVYQ